MKNPRISLMTFSMFKKLVILNDSFLTPHNWFSIKIKIDRLLNEL